MYFCRARRCRTKQNRGGLVYCRSICQHHAPATALSMGGYPVSLVTPLRNLGICIDSDLVMRIIAMLRCAMLPFSYSRSSWTNVTNILVSGWPLPCNSHSKCELYSARSHRIHPITGISIYHRLLTTHPDTAGACRLFNTADLNESRSRSRK